MKKILLGACALAIAVSTFTAPARADNSEEVIIGVLGGALGGLILGEALARPRYAPPVYAPPPVYVQPGYGVEYIEEEPVVVCKRKRYRVWDPYRQAWLYQSRRVCR